MDLHNEIKDFTISYFNRIQSHIIQNQNKYEILIPDKYKSYFNSSRIVICFDEKIASKFNCEFIIPGSWVLDKIIKNCMNMGPIVSSKINENENNTYIVYYYNIKYSGINNKSFLDSVCINVETLAPVTLNNKNQKIDQIGINELGSKKITSTYLSSINEIKKRHMLIEQKFLKKSQDIFQNELSIFVKKYDSQIRELDKKINHKELTSDDFQKIKQFRFDVLKTIKQLEYEKTHLINILQKKHKIILDYGLIGSEVIILNRPHV